MNKIFRVSMSFAIVLVSYWAYALVVVPVIAPAAAPESRHKVPVDYVVGAKERAELEAKELAAFFPPGSWELNDKPKMLESDQAKLLVGNYTPKPDGFVELKPCTIIFFPKKELLEKPLAERQPVILEAPEGAWLKFDKSFDLSSASSGDLNLIGGKIPGPVTIRSQGKLDDPEDDLRITTRNIVIDEQWIHTKETVRFRHGKHIGSGREMWLELEPDEDSARKKKGFNVAGIRSFLLRKIDNLRLLLAEEDKEESKASPQTLARSASQIQPQKTKEPELVPVEVACTGEFRFDIPERRAAFKDNVVVSRFRTKGPADQLLCDELVIHFDERKTKKTDDAKSASSKKKKGLDDLEPSWLEARGIHRPATIYSAEEKVEGSAREIQYHLADRRIVLQDKTGKEAVRLKQADNLFVAKSMEYLPEEGSVGQLFADGPGAVNARLDETSEERFTATWQKELRLQPHDKNRVISLTGGASLDYGPVGKLSATSIYFYMIEKPKQQNGAGGNAIASNRKPGEKATSNLQPDRMRADGDVKIESKEVSGDVDQFEVWFVMDQSASSNPRNNLAASSGRVSSPSRPLAGAYANPGFPGNPASAGTSEEKKPKQHFHVKARVLQARVLLRETDLPNGKKKRDTEVTNLTMLDNVELIETETDKPGQEPIIAKGDRIQVQNTAIPNTSGKNLPNASINLFGRPAEFVGRGLGLSGTNINLNRGTNRLWVNGPGTMKLPPMKKDLQGQPNEKPEEVFITWHQEMDFDGRTIVFLDQVTAETKQQNKHQKLYTEQLSATLTERIDFNKADRAEPGPELLLLTCHGGVRLNSSNFDKLGRLESTEMAEASRLQIDNSTGKVHAKGPGEVKTVRRGGAEDSKQFGFGGMMAAKPRAAYGNAVPPNAKEKEDGLTYVKIRFQGSVKGDIDKNWTLMSFNDQVAGTFGEVLDWQQTLPEDNPDALGEKDAILHCQRLELLQMPSPTDGKPMLDMKATGNVSIEGKQFTAQGANASFSNQKKLLILEGDGRTEAILYHQEKAGSVPQKIPAKTIKYWLEENRYQIGGTKSFQLQMVPTR